MSKAPKTMKKQKIRPHHKLAQVLLSGKPVSREDIIASFANDQAMLAVMYRIPNMMLEIKILGGIIKVVKDGRKIKTYQLVNPEIFDSNGQLIQVDKTIETVIQEFSDPAIENHVDQQPEAAPAV